MFLAPSAIHFINAEKGLLCQQNIDQNILDVSRKIVENGDYPKVQVVEKEGQWFTLNNSQLALCRRLEEDGECSRVKVDVVSLSDIPQDICRMMIPSPKDLSLAADKKSTKAPEGDQSRSTGKGYQKLDTQDPGKETTPVEHTSDSSDKNASSTDNSDFDETDSECDWSQDEGDSSDCDTSDENKSTDDERECLL